MLTDHEFLAALDPVSPLDSHQPITTAESFPGGLVVPASPAPCHVLRGDVAEVLREFEDDRFHAVLCDPPYGLSEPLTGEDVAAVLVQWLAEGTYQRTKGRRKPAKPGGEEGTAVSRLTGGGFMGAEWDNFVPGPKTWAEVYRVTRPGGYLLAFAGTRTEGWMQISLMLAGWEVLDVIDWLYACLSEDTEILVDGRWCRVDEVAEGRTTLTFDPQTETFAWSPILERFVYAYDRPAISIESDHTSQLLSPEHRCLVRDGDRWCFDFASAIGPTARVPVLSRTALDDVLRGLRGADHEGASAPATGQDADLLARVQWTLASAGDAGERKSGTRWLERGGQGETPRAHDRGQQSLVEGWDDLSAPEGRICAGALRAGSGGVQSDGTNRRVRDGASTDRGDGHGSGPVADGVRAPREPRPAGQPAGELDAVRLEQGPQDLRVTWSPVADLARVSEVHYRGRMWCVRVATGAFVARRNGRIFVTGNCGFPKGGNVGKRVDDLLGGEREVSGSKIGRPGYSMTNGPANAVFGQGIGGSGDPARECAITDPATGEGAIWDDWSTTEKPAREPVIVCRKPLSEKSVAANLLKWRTGALNTGACRIPSGEDCARKPAVVGNTAAPFGRGQAMGGLGSDAGRWPANVMFTHSEACDETCSEGCPVRLLDEQSGRSKSGVQRAPKGKGGIWSPSQGTPCGPQYGDIGGASRFFFCAKASPADREEGTEGLPIPEGKKGRNNHPTVKPVPLLRELARLITAQPVAGWVRGEGGFVWEDRPPGEVLVPFAGSGSEVVACALEGLRAVGVERETEFHAIAQARVAKALEFVAAGKVPKHWRRRGE